MRFTLSLLLFCAALAPAEIIDRVALSVGNQVITENQIDDEIRLTAFQNHTAVNITADEKKAAAERLLEQALVRREMRLSRYPAPPIAEAQTALREAETAAGGPEAFKRKLAQYGISSSSLLAHLEWQRTLLRFIDYRFRPGIQVSDEDIKAYYDRQVADAKSSGAAPPPSLDQARSKIEQLLTDQRVDQALDRWLGDSRTQVEIRYHTSALE